MTHGRRPAARRAGIAAFLSCLLWSGSGCLAQESIARPDLLDPAIRSRVASLLPDARPALATVGTATQATDAIKKGDFTRARDIITALLPAARTATWRSYPLATLAAAMELPNDADYIAKLSEWVKTDPQSSIPYLIKALNAWNRAWRTRGGNFAGLVQPEHLAAFEDDLALAHADILKSIERDGTVPYSAYMRSRILFGHGNTAEMVAAFQDSIAKFPEYEPLYKIRLESLAPKWGGDTATMYGFVAKYADTAAATSPRKMLYLDLYAGLLDVASRACGEVPAESAKSCVSAKMSTLVTPDLEAKIPASLSALAKADAYETTLLVTPLLRAMLPQRGGAAALGVIAQQAADALGSSNQIATDNSDHNNFALDSIAAEIWLADGSTENAEKKYNQALRDLAWTAFPNDEERDVARAGIYDGLAGVDIRAGRFENVIADRTAAIMLAGNANADLRYLKCYAYYSLKRYAEAIADCTIQIDATGDLRARFYRARSNTALGKPDAARDDFLEITETENSDRVSAVIDLSVIHAEQHDYDAMLDTLSGHPYMFDERLASRQNVAIAYNNRCYAYMKLGRRREALDDCDASLKYGNLPDAYQKQQQLMKDLRTNPE